MWDPNIPCQGSQHPMEGIKIFHDVGPSMTFLQTDLPWLARWRSVDPSFLDDSPGGVNALTRKGTAVPRLFFFFKILHGSSLGFVVEIRDFGERIPVRFFFEKRDSWSRTLGPKSNSERRVNFVELMKFPGSEKNTPLRFACFLEKLEA